MRIDLTGQVAIVTGAGNGLGKSHALLLAERGARVVVNDLGGKGLEAAEAVADEIRAKGGEAIALAASVTDFDEVQAMVEQVISQWGRIDILVNNAGFLRDRTFAKMGVEEFRAVLDVHVMGAVHCTKAVWATMQAQNYGRVIVTSSASGLYGSFGQANYSAAKMALVGLMIALATEGVKYDIRVNCFVPTAGTSMLEGIMPPDLLDLFAPEAASPAMLALVAPQAPTRTTLLAGAGGFEQAHITLTEGIFLGRCEDAAEQILARLGEIGDRAKEFVPDSGVAQSQMEMRKAGYQPAA